MSYNIQNWHRRYVQQTRWTHALVSYLFQRANISSSQKILEVGCGTGAVLQELIRPLNAHYLGLDINQEYLSFFQQTHPNTDLVLGDAHQLPFTKGSFDVCLCHYLLLWVNNPSQVLREMVRMTRSGGIVMALAEPDYGGRIDYPLELSQVGRWQMNSLEQQGANPIMGRKLRALFTDSGVSSVEAGALGGQWSSGFDQPEFESEWNMLQSDLSNQPEILAQLPGFRDLDRLARLKSQRILYVPTFYAWGYVP